MISTNKLTIDFVKKVVDANLPECWLPLEAVQKEHALKVHEKASPVDFLLGNG
ncbi:hypothetical protein ACFLVH_01315 [Chloroflexota bacterium]